MSVRHMKHVGENAECNIEDEEEVDDDKVYSTFRKNH